LVLTKMANKKNIYWACQIFGWTFFTALNLIFFKLNNSTNLIDILNYLIWLPVGISLTHVYKLLIIKFNALKFNVIKQIPFVIVAGFIKAFLFFVLTVGIAKVFGIITYKINLVAALSNIFSLSVIFILWDYLGSFSVIQFNKIN